MQPNFVYKCKLLFLSYGNNLSLKIAVIISFYDCVKHELHSFKKKSVIICKYAYNIFLKISQHILQFDNNSRRKIDKKLQYTTQKNKWKAKCGKIFNIINTL